QPPKRAAKKKGRGRKSQKKSAELTGQPELRKPRVLLERTSVQYDDPDELRQEIDLILAWLQRDDLSRSDRQILQTELQNLAPALEESRIQKAAERRAGKIERALTPKVDGDSRAQLVAAVKIIDSIKPLSDRPGYSYLMYGDQMIVLQNEE